MVEFLTSSPVQIAVVLFLVAVVFFGFVREALPADVIALLAMGTLMLTGIMSVKETLGVFSNAAPLTIAAMFVMSAALDRTGVIDQAGRWVTTGDHGLAAHSRNPRDDARRHLPVSLHQQYASCRRADPGRHKARQVAQDFAGQAPDPALLRLHLRRYDHADRHVHQPAGRWCRPERRHGPRSACSRLRQPGPSWHWRA